MATEYADPTLWGLIVVIGVATYLIRVSFIGLFGYLDGVPDPVERGLRYVPAAVLAALVVPAFVTLGGEAGLAADRLVGGALAAGVAWRTESVFATMAAGMGGLWVMRFLLLPLV
jgi:branched-subunit amino acid transport protein